MSLRRPEDQDILIIGATGDLSRRKLLPALYNLFAVDALLPQGGQIIGVGRGRLSDDDFRGLALDAVQSFSRTPVDKKAWKVFGERLAFVSAGPEGYGELARRCEQPSRLVYPAVPPSAFPPVVRALATHVLVQGTRLIVEKPYGNDLASAQELDRTLREVFDESQIFRIDHYLGKETVQNILVFRFGNSLFERVWNRDAIDHVQITVAESIGVEGRGAYYEEAGALRDIIQNHVLQVLSLLAMDPPSAFQGEAVRDEKAKLLKAVQPVDPRCVVRGQYTAGRIDGAEVSAYREEEDVGPDSPTETFAALELRIDNWRWAGVPFLLRTGKRLPRRATEVKIGFRDAPIQFFEGTEVGELPANHLTLCIQPDESITFAFLAKVPGPEITVKPVHMDFSYGESFMVKPSEAYERLLHDAMDGDHTLFAREDSVELAWRVLQPVLDAMPPVCFYPAGTWGPREANALIAPRTWHVK
jgi:glucose-6-phosphate 1-dehydrogenase